ncbi:hypothetical protein J5690_02250 [bacterium]|nr:hypothetical protein [bacterium]
MGQFSGNYIKTNRIKYIIGHSLGGFYALCINADVKKIVINPCLKPHIELPKLDDFDQTFNSLFQPQKILKSCFF